MAFIEGCILLYLIFQFFCGGIVIFKARAQRKDTTWHLSLPQVVPVVGDNEKLPADLCELSQQCYNTDVNKEHHFNMSYVGARPW